MALCSALQVNDGDLSLVPPRRGEKLYMVPQGIRPVVQLTAIEVHHQSFLLLPAIIDSLCKRNMIRQDQPNPEISAVFASVI